MPNQPTQSKPDAATRNLLIRAHHAAQALRFAK